MRAFLGSMIMLTAKNMNVAPETTKSWAIYIDIEGFSANYSRDIGRVIAGLQGLINGILRIGNTVCAERAKRLCAYQAGGDGFFIDSQYGSPNVPIAIAVVLMRNALLAGALTTAGISEGTCIDVRGWRSNEIRQKAKGDDVQLGDTGHMRLFPVIGTAYIQAHRMTKEAKGCLLSVDTEMLTRSSLDSRQINGNKVDWIHADFEELHRITTAAEISLGEQDALENELKQQVSAAASTFNSAEWVENTLKFNGCE